MNRTLIFFLIIAFNAVAQVEIPIIDTLNYKPIKGLKEYYQNVNNAELAIIEKDYLKASNLYLEAFKHKQPFMQDLHNFTNNNNKLNFNKDLFLKQTILWRQATTNHNTTKQYLNFIAKFYPNIDSNIVLSFENIIDTVKFLSRLNNNLISKIDSIEEKDQYIRNKKVTLQEFRSTDTLNYYTLLKLYKNYTINENTIKKRGMNSVDLLLLHASRYGFTEWIPIIYKEVMKGNYPNRRYAALVDSYIQNNFSSNIDSSGYAYISGYALYDKYIIPKNEISKKNMEYINKRRTILMIDNYINQQKKQMWNFRHGNEILFYEYFSYVFVFPDATEQEISDAKKEQDIILKDISSKHKELLIFEKEAENYDINL